MNKELSRNDILTAFQNTFEPDPFVFSMWQGGAIANNRMDDWSDIDLQFIVADEYTEDCIHKIEELLNSIGSLDLHYRLPEPTWHGHSQILYRLVNSSPYLVLDIVIMKRSNTNRFLEVERHGNPYIHFDKESLITEKHLSEDEMLNKIKRRFKHIETTFPAFQIFIQKEINRKYPIDAMGYYLRMTVNPLIELMGMIERPFQFDFNLRYIHTDFSDEWKNKVKELLFIKDFDELIKKHELAKDLYSQLIDMIKDKYEL